MLISTNWPSLDSNTAIVRMHMKTDALVYELYGLTEQEITIVEG
jgi:hypothetical protein